MTKPLTGKCRYCTAPLKLIDGKWLHDGIWTLVHMVKQARDPECGKQDQFALAGPSKGGS